MCSCSSSFIHVQRNDLEYLDRFSLVPFSQNLDIVNFPWRKLRFSFHPLATKPSSSPAGPNSNAAFASAAPRYQPVGLGNTRRSPRSGGAGRNVGERGCVKGDLEADHFTPLTPVKFIERTFGGGREFGTAEFGAHTTRHLFRLGRLRHLTEDQTSHHQTAHPSSAHREADTS